MADAKIRMGDLRPYMTQEKGDDMSSTIGRAFVNGILSNMGQGQIPGQGGGLRELTGALKDIDEVQERRGHRGRNREIEELVDLVDDLRDEIRRNKRKGGGDGESGIAQVMTAFMESQQNMTKMLQESQNSVLAAVLDRLGDKLGNGGDMQKWLAELGTNYLNGQMQRDPKREYEDEREYWASRLNTSSQSSYDKWMKEQEFQLRKEESSEERALRREQWKHEEEIRRQEAESRTAQLQALAQAVGGMAGRGQNPGPGESEGTPPLYPYTCAACQHTWFQPTLEEKVSCPKCQAQLEVSIPENPGA